MGKNILILGCLIISCLTLFCQIGEAQEATPSNVVITNNRDNLLLYMEVENAFSEKIKSAILSGIPVSFSFYISIERVRNFWPNKIIRDKNISHTIQYDTLKKTFTIKKSWKKGPPIITKSFEDAQQLMSELKNCRIVKLKKLNKGDQYLFRIKTKLNKLTLPYHLDYILFFVSRWDFETDWYTVEFTY